MPELIEYKCPCCGGAIKFDSDLQKLKCPYCDTEYEVDDLRGYDEELKSDRGDDTSGWDGTAGTEWNPEEEEKLISYICNSCGGEIIADETTAATSCPFCGNPVVMKEKLQGSCRPDYVIPFKLSKEAAKKAFSKHLSKKLLLPKVFKDESHIAEIKGVYVPFWLYNTEADATVRFRGTKVRHWSDSRYSYTQTRYYFITRDGALTFRHVPVDGSSKMADDLMESIEPYDFSAAVDFETAYLAGYFADKYDVSSTECIKRANERIKQSITDELRSTVVGYTSVRPESASMRLSDCETEYALLPVWLMTTEWKGKNYMFAMNGQTGKFVGNLPLDKKAWLKWFAIFLAIAAPMAYALALLFTNL